MKRIKRYAQFGASIKEARSPSETMLDDAKHIVISHLGEVDNIDLQAGGIEIAMSDSLKSRIKALSLTERPSVREEKGCIEHLEEETPDVFYSINLNKGICVLCTQTIESLLGEWLRERFPAPDKFARESQIFYLDENGSAIFYYYEGDRQDKGCHVSHYKIWSFFSDTLGLEDGQIRDIVHDWLLSEFGLDLEPRRW